MQHSITQRGILVCAAGAALYSLTMPLPLPAAEFRRLTASEYRDRMTAGWIGQMAGVAWGGPTEFKWKDAIIPEEAMPRWSPEMINDAFGQDDLYVEMTFLRTLEQHGFDVSIRQAGIDFANSRYSVWCANRAGRSNLRDGIAPPDSSHPRFNRCPNDIDYQIEADYSGLIAPGLMDVPIRLGEKFGRLMNYGDGMYGGQFIGGMYAAAFFETDRIRVIEAALKCIPERSHYAEMVRDMLRWYREHPGDWEATWHLAQKKYREDPEYQKAANGSIDVRINGACVLMGLLYGEGDLDRTIIISTRCGHDSDCNPSNAAGVLFTMIGASRLPERFTKELSRETVFNYTAYNFPGLVEVCEKLARQAIQRAGGRIERDAAGEEVFVIPMQRPQPSELQLSWAPGPIANSRFTEEEMEQITEPGPRRLFAMFAPGWEYRDLGWEMGPGPLEEWNGRRNVYLTHPLNPSTGCTLFTKADVPAGRRTVLRLLAGHHPHGDWLLIVMVNGQPMLEKPVGPDTAAGGWLAVEVDLSEYAGESINLEVVNQPTGWSFEGAYWGEIAIISTAP